MLKLTPPGTGVAPRGWLRLIVSTDGALKSEFFSCSGCAITLMIQPRLSSFFANEDDAVGLETKLLLEAVTIVCRRMRTYFSQLGLSPDLLGTRAKLHIQRNQLTTTQGWVLLGNHQHDSDGAGFDAFYFDSPNRPN